MQTHTSIEQMSKMLANLGRWLDEAVQYADSRGFEPERLLPMRLAPDQFSLVRHVQTAADTAKLTASRLGGEDAPSHPDEETTIAELQERLAATRSFLDGLEPAAFDGAEGRLLHLRFLPDDKRIRGDDYLVEFGLPNFYHHVNMAYGILRHAGVVLGKRKYLGDLTLRDAS